MGLISTLAATAAAKVGHPADFPRLAKDRPDMGHQSFLLI